MGGRLWNGEDKIEPLSMCSSPIGPCLFSNHNHTFIMILNKIIDHFNNSKSVCKLSYILTCCNL